MILSDRKGGCFPCASFLLPFLFLLFSHLILLLLLLLLLFLFWFLFLFLFLIAFRLSCFALFVSRYFLLFFSFFISSISCFQVLSCFLYFFAHFFAHCFMHHFIHYASTPRIPLKSKLWSIPKLVTSISIALSFLHFTRICVLLYCTCFRVKKQYTLPCLHIKP